MQGDNRTIDIASLSEEGSPGGAGSVLKARPARFIREDIGPPSARFSDFLDRPSRPSSPARLALFGRAWLFWLSQSHGADRSLTVELVGTAKVCKAAGGYDRILTFRPLLNAPQATEYLFGSFT